jgi:hypothetical protein
MGTGPFFLEVSTVIPNTKDRELQSSGVGASGSFGISLNDAAHIMKILRDTLYSDKILAVLREYSSNAWDSHRDAGKGDVPIKVTLPTAMHPTLSIRDYGNGLSQQDVFQVYTQYGASTKRNSDETVGMLGIGSKSGFAYSDTFTITSWHGGVKRIYVAALDKTEKGVINQLHEEPCGDETGVEIQIAVRPHDIWEFEQKARRLFKFFHPRPDINTSLPPVPKKRLAAGTIYDGDDDGAHGWVAVMGCVPYKLDLDQLRAGADHDGGVAEFLDELSGAVFFDIGEVTINASREELKYTDSTKASLIEKFNLLVEDYVRTTLDEIKGSNLNPWEKRVKAQVLRRLKLPIPKDCEELVEGSVSLKDKVPKSFVLLQNKAAVGSISVADNTRFLLKDDDRFLTGFYLTSNDYLVRPTDKKFDWEEIKKDLDKMLQDTNLTGVPVKKLSELDWHPPRRKMASSKEYNPKHRRKVFRFKPSEGNYYRPWSRFWEAEEHEPSDKDIWVVIEHFQGSSCNFFTLYDEAEAWAKQFVDEKYVMPEVIGYKSTEKKPVDMTTLQGRHFKDWYNDFLKSLITDKLKKTVEKWHWSKIISEHHYYQYQAESRKSAQKKASELLGEDHPLVQMVQKNRSAKQALKNLSYNEQKQLETLVEKLKDRLPKPEADEEYERLEKKYPLLEIHDLGNIWGEHADAWAQYIKMCDELEELKKNQPPQLKIVANHED